MNKLDVSSSKYLLRWLWLITYVCLFLCKYVFYVFYGRERERGKGNDDSYCALSPCLTTRIIFLILSLVFYFGLINLWNTNILWCLFLTRGNHGLQSKSCFVSDNCNISFKSILPFLPFAFFPWRIVDWLYGFLPFDFDQGENLTEDKKNWKRVMTILIFLHPSLFIAAHC